MQKKLPDQDTRSSHGPALTGRPQRRDRNGPDDSFGQKDQEEDVKDLLKTIMFLRSVREVESTFKECYLLELNKQRAETVIKCQ